MYFSLDLKKLILEPHRYVHKDYPITFENISEDQDINRTKAISMYAHLDMECETLLSRVVAYRETRKDNADKFYNLQTGVWLKDIKGKVFYLPISKVYCNTECLISFKDCFYILYGKSLEDIEIYRPSESSALRNKVWNNEPDHGLGKVCFCCLKQVTFKEFEVGHIVPLTHGGETEPSNLRVICKSCNRGVGGMHSMHAYEYMFKTKKPGIKFIPEDDAEKIKAKLIYYLSESIKSNSIPDHIKKLIAPCKSLPERLRGFDLIFEENKEESE